MGVRWETMPPEDRINRTAARSPHGEREIDLRQIDLRMSAGDIERSLGSAREILERHLLADCTLYDGRTVRQVFYELTDIAIQALGEARARA